MLAVDELDLEGGEERLSDGVIQARPSGGEHSEDDLLSVAGVAGSWRDRPARDAACRRGPISLVEH
jgi:hypothetical protein